MMKMVSGTAFAISAMVGSSAHADDIDERQMASLKEELSAAQTEIEDLKSILESADPALLINIALSKTNIMACLADDMVFVLAFRRDQNGDRVSLMTEQEIDAEVYSGDRATIVRGDTVTIIDGDRFNVMSGDTEINGTCHDIGGWIAHLTSILPKLDWDQLYD